MINKITTKNNSIEGTGVFSKDSLKKGELICVFTGSTISTDEANIKYSQGFDYMLQMNQSEFLLLDSDLKYMNHSCEPNAFFQESGKLYALRDIKKGEEITFDYSLNEDTPFEMNCLCGSSSCRKKIGPFSQLSDSDKRTHKSQTTPYLQKKTSYCQVKIDRRSGQSYLDLNDFKDIVDISKVHSYEFSKETIDRLIDDQVMTLKFYDKDGNLIKP